MPDSGDTGDFLFREAELSDGAIIHRWLSAPHVTRWTHRVFSTISRALDGASPGAESMLYIVEFAGGEIGCAHVYSAHGDPNWTAISDVTAQTRAIDFLIGEADFLNRKIGQAMLRALAGKIFRDTDTDRIVACPHPDNWPAVIALKRAGFREKGRHPIPTMNAMYLTVTRQTFKG